jgi:predicted FMN-binding regulatory protein PaiB
MYLPKQFAEERLDVLHEAISSAQFATLVTFGSTGLQVSYAPVDFTAGLLKGSVGLEIPIAPSHPSHDVTSPLAAQPRPVRA